MEQRARTRQNFEILHQDGRKTDEFRQVMFAQLLMDNIVQTQGEDELGSERFRRLLAEAQLALDAAVDAPSLVRTLRRITSSLEASEPKTPPG